MAVAGLTSLLTIDIGIDPELGEVAGLLISWHGVFTAVGIAAGLWLALRLTSIRGIDPDEAYTIGLLAVVGGIIGARLLFVAENWSDFENDLGKIFAINEGGISIYGALIGGVLFGLVYALFRRALVPILPALDAGAPGALLGMAIGRIGDIINGEHISDGSDLPWAVRYTHENSPSFGLAPQHPATGYEMLGDLVILAILLFIFFRVRRDGLVFFVWLFAYGVLRLLVSFLREDDKVLGDLVMAQVIAIGGIAIGLAGILWVWARRAGPSRAERRRGERTAAVRK